MRKEFQHTQKETSWRLDTHRNVPTYFGPGAIVLFISLFFYLMNLRQTPRTHRVSSVFYLRGKSPPKKKQNKIKEAESQPPATSDAPFDFCNYMLRNRRRHKETRLTFIPGSRSRLAVLGKSTKLLDEVGLVWRRKINLKPSNGTKPSRSAERQTYRQT